MFFEQNIIMFIYNLQKNEQVLVFYVISFLYTKTDELCLKNLDTVRRAF